MIGYAEKLHGSDESHHRLNGVAEDNGSTLTIVFTGETPIMDDSVVQVVMLWGGVQDVMLWGVVQDVMLWGVVQDVVLWE